MGELADDVREGRMCSWCGVCFMRSHGHTVLCKECLKDWLEDGETIEALLKDYGIRPAKFKEY